MGVLLQSGVFNEDFNYGYPYNRVVANSAPEFEYSGLGHVWGGTVPSSFKGRNSFTLHWANRDLEPKNYDAGIHGGSPSDNFYYLLFPVLQWNQVQVLTLKVHLFDSGTLTFDKSFDGYIKDNFYLVVNGQVRHHTDNTAGHGWTTVSFNLGRGWNQIDWVLVTSKYQPPKTRGGKSKTPSKVPALRRYLRITSINITNVDAMADGPHSRSAMGLTGTMTAVGTVEAQGKPSTMQMYTSFYNGKPLGPMTIAAHMYFFTDWLYEHNHGQAAWTIATNLTANARIIQVHESEDGGMALGTTGALTIKVPIDTVQTIQDRLKYLKNVSFGYPDPVVVGGQLVMPAYPSQQASVISSLHSYTYNDPVDPASPSHVLRVPGTLSWRATDVTGADNSSISAWPEHSSTSNPQWLSSGDYQPTVHPHEHFSEEGLNISTYSRVVRFYWATAQHMWINLGTRPTGTSYTWTFVGIFHPVYKIRYNHILDNGLPTAQYPDALDRDLDTVLGENVSGNRSALGIYPNGLMFYNTNTHTVVSKQAPEISHRPQIITAVFGDNGGVTVHQIGHGLNHRTRVVIPLHSSPYFVLGRWFNHVARESSSHMSLMEVIFHDRVLSNFEIMSNAKYLMGTYNFSKYR